MTKLKRLKYLAWIPGLLLATAVDTATASTIDFDFRTNSGRVDLPNPATFTSDFITVEVATGPGDPNINTRGIGVLAGPDENRIGSDFLTVQNEFVTFTFDREVVLHTGTFWQQGGQNNDEMEVFTIDANPMFGSGVIVDDGFTTLDIGLTGTIFQFRHTFGEGMRISDLSVNAVPLPAAVWMFLSGLAMLGFAGKRRGV